MNPQFRREAFDQHFLADAAAMMERKWAKVRMDPQRAMLEEIDLYILVEEHGRLRIFTVRSDENALLGYAACFVIPPEDSGPGRFAQMNTIHVRGPFPECEELREQLQTFAQAQLEADGFIVINPRIT